MSSGNDSWRPTTFEEFDGQDDLIALLRDDMDAAIAGDKALPHILLYGQPGLGKTSIAELCAAVRGVPLHTLMGPSVTEETLSKVLGDLDASGYDRQGRIIDHKLVRPCCVNIDEPECIPTKVWESLHRVLESEPDGRRILEAKEPGRRERFKVWVPEFTLILTTNYYGKLRKVAAAALNRFPIKWNFQPYKAEEIQRMIVRYARVIGVRVTENAVNQIADRSLGVPRTAKQLLRQARTRVTAMVHRNERQDLTIDEDVASASAELMKIDKAGLPETHRRYLEILAKAGGKVGLPSLVAALCVDEEMVRVEVEPDLIRKGFVAIVPGGRQITADGLAHIGTEKASPLLSRRLTD